MHTNAQLSLTNRQPETSNQTNITQTNAVKSNLIKPFAVAWKTHKITLDALINEWNIEVMKNRSLQERLEYQINAGHHYNHSIKLFEAATNERHFSTAQPVDFIRFCQAIVMPLPQETYSLFAAKTYLDINFLITDFTARLASLKSYHLYLEPTLANLTDLVNTLHARMEYYTHLNASATHHRDYSSASSVNHATAAITCHHTIRLLQQRRSATVAVDPAPFSEIRHYCRRHRNLQV